MRILLITVGGSSAPVVTAARMLKPDRIIFICSEMTQAQVTGPGKPCKIIKKGEVVEELPNIPSQLSLGDRHNPETDVITFPNPDHLSAVYETISDRVRALQQEYLNGQFIVDYTGGTKTMSLALGTVALDYGLELYVTTTTRDNVIKVERGERARRASITGLVVRRLLEQDIPRFLEQYQYGAAIAELENLLCNAEIPNVDQVDMMLSICQGLDFWDRFDHREALISLEPLLSRPQFRDLVLFLKRVIGSRGQVALAVDANFSAENGMTGHGYEVVEDILLNAQRRAQQQRYDDAVARLYRGIELLSQTRLWLAYGIKTGDLDLEKIPEQLRADYEQKRHPQKKKISLALIQGYELLHSLDNDPLGALYGEAKEKLLNILEVRNYSILAHGMQPIAEKDYHKVYGVLGIFIENGIQACIATQQKGKKKSRPQSPVQFPQRLSF